MQHALQGHPESPRLWSRKIDGIIRNKALLTPTKHEPCIYYGRFNGNKVLLSRQVDDFAVASRSMNTAKGVIAEISKNLSVPMHDLGILRRFNGVDVQQTQDFIKIYNETFVRKILENYTWETSEDKSPKYPTPMRDDAAYMKQMDTDIGPDSKLDKNGHSLLEKECGFKYRKALGELLFCMVTCRPDISFPVIKLAKYANKPAKIHYQAVKQVFRYLRSTIDHGIYFWRRTSTRTL